MGQIVAIEGDVHRSAVHLQIRKSFDVLGDQLCQRLAAAQHADQGDLFFTAATLDDLMGDPRQRTAYVCLFHNTGTEFFGHGITSSQKNSLAAMRATRPVSLC